MVIPLLVVNGLLLDMAPGYPMVAYVGPIVGCSTGYDLVIPWFSLVILWLFSGHPWLSHGWLCCYELRPVCRQLFVARLAFSDTQVSGGRHRAESQRQDVKLMVGSAVLFFQGCMGFVRTSLSNHQTSLLLIDD